MSFIILVHRIKQRMTSNQWYDFQSSKADQEIFLKEVSKKIWSDIDNLTMDQATAFADVAKALLLGPSRMTNGGQRFLPLVLNTTFPPNQRLEALSFFEQQLMQIREIEATADAAWIYSYDSQKAIESRSEEAGSSPTTTMSAQDKEAIIREWKKLQLLATNAQERLSRFRSRCQSTRARLSTALASDGGVDVSVEEWEGLIGLVRDMYEFCEAWDAR